MEWLAWLGSAANWGRCAFHLFVRATGAPAVAHFTHHSLRGTRVVRPGTDNHRLDDCNHVWGRTGSRVSVPLPGNPCSLHRNSAGLHKMMRPALLYSRRVVVSGGDGTETNSM